MEEIDELQPPRPAEFEEEIKDTSIWRQSTTPAVALTLLATCGIAINVHNPVEAIGNLLFSVPVTFLFWWLICTFIVWLWRAIFGR
jgi:hypothetical protein